MPLAKISFVHLVIFCLLIGMIVLLSEVKKLWVKGKELIITCDI